MYPNLVVKLDVTELFFVFNFFFHPIVIKVVVVLPSSLWPRAKCIKQFFTCMFLSGLCPVNALYSWWIVLHIYIFEQVLRICNKKQYCSTLYDGF